MSFEWDPDKNNANIIKHKISFEDAKDIFSGYVMETEDPRAYGEPRLWAIGETSEVVLFVVYTWRGQNRRIISARQASRKEREIYYGH